MRWWPSIALVAPGETSILDEHYGRRGRTGPAGHRGPEPPAEKEFLALGPVAEAFLVGAAAAGVTKLATELAEIPTLQRRARHRRRARRAAPGGGVPPVARRRRPLDPGRRRRGAAPRGRPGRRWC